MRDRCARGTLVGCVRIPGVDRRPYRSSTSWRLAITKVLLLHGWYSAPASGTPGSTIPSIARDDGRPRSHAPRGNAIADAPRHQSRRRAAERPNERSHAEPGNEDPAAWPRCRKTVRISIGLRTISR